MLVYGRSLTPGYGDYKATGVYRHAVTSGLIPAAIRTAAPVYSFRWTDTTHMALVTAVRVTMTNATGFTAGQLRFDLDKVTDFTSAATGGDAATPSAISCKLRTSMAATKVQQIQIAGAGGVLTLLDATFGSHPLNAVQFATTGGGNAAILPKTALVGTPDSDAESHPVVLEANEGLILRATCPATGTWHLAVEIEWLEVPVAP